MKVLLFKKKSENIVEELKGEAQLEKQVWISLKVDAYMLI